MKERPILFSGAMVRAILDGRKTQTRRVLKQAVGPSLSVGIEEEPGVAELSWLSGPGPGYDVEETIKRVACPYGQPGDRLWVRETWKPSIVHSCFDMACDCEPAVKAIISTAMTSRTNGICHKPLSRAGTYLRCICRAGHPAWWWRSPTCASRG